MAAPRQDRIGARIDVEDQTERTEVADAFVHGEGKGGDRTVLSEVVRQLCTDGFEARFASQKEGAGERTAGAECATQAAHVGRDEVRGIGAGVVTTGANELAAARDIEARLQGQPT